MSKEFEEELKAYKTTYRITASMERIALHFFQAGQRIGIDKCVEEVDTFHNTSMNGDYCELVGCEASLTASSNIADTIRKLKQEV